MMEGNANLIQEDFPYIWQYINICNKYVETRKEQKTNKKEETLVRTRRKEARQEETYLEGGGKNR